MTKGMLEECPNCGSIWGPGSEEYDWQQCDCCGYPDNDKDCEDGENDYDNFDDEDPNDSRNL